MKTENELRHKRPQMGLKADHRRNRTAAIAGKCLSCAGARSEVAECKVFSCWLWAVRPYQADGHARPANSVPSEADYGKMIDALPKREMNENAKAALAKFRAEKAALQVDDDGDGGDDDDEDQD